MGIDPVAELARNLTRREHELLASAALRRVPPAVHADDPAEVSAARYLARNGLVSDADQPAATDRGMKVLQALGTLDA